MSFAEGQVVFPESAPEREAHHELPGGAQMIRGVVDHADPECAREVAFRGYFPTHDARERERAVAGRTVPVAKREIIEAFAVEQSGRFYLIGQKKKHDEKEVYPIST